MSTCGYTCMRACVYIQRQRSVPKALLITYHIIIFSEIGSLTEPGAH